MKGRRKAHEEHESHERWLVSYADFITLLFAFFIVLYATSERNLEKTKEFQESIKKYLTKDGGMGGFVGAAGGPAASQVNQANQFDSPIKPPLPTYPSNSARVSQSLETIEQYIEERMSQEEVEKWVFDISPNEYGVRVSLAANQIFPSGSSRFRTEAVSLLDKLAKLIKDLNYGIWVESHTSDQAAKSTSYPSPWELAASRSTTVVRYLAKRHGLSTERMAALSYGAERPLVPNNSTKNRDRNERLDILILSEGAPL